MGINLVDSSLTMKNLNTSMTGQVSPSSTSRALSFVSRVEFSAELAHEFQTPLAILKGNLELLETERSVKNKRAVRVMMTTIDRLARLVDRRLETATFYIAGPGGLRRVRADLLLGDVLDDCRLLAETRGVSLLADPIGRFSFPGDADQMREVFLNLVSNALQHTKPGGSIRLSASVVKESIEFIVEDTGSGISSADLPHIFERFYRIQERYPGNLQDADTRGTGLGLSICRYIVEAHGGSINVESQVGKGSRFSVRLPLVSSKTTA